jgi:hypothetical protein
MNQEPRRPRDTKEFVAGWQNIVEAQVVSDLTVALPKLAESEAGGTAALARHVAHALQLAASPAGGLQAAVHYLCEAAAQAEEPGTTS